MADYYPFGKILREWTTCEVERYLTTYHERDKETGYDYRGARYYDSELGRFLGVYPLAADFAAWSAYTYVLDNPIIFIDPDGRNGIISIDKEAKTVTVKVDLHWSADTGPFLEAESGRSNDYVSSEAWQEHLQDSWGGGLHSVSVDGVDYDVSFDINIVTHETHKQAAVAFTDDPSSNFLFVTDVDRANSNYGADTQILTLNARQQRQGDKQTYSHEVGHTLGLGHNNYQNADGTYSISSYRRGQRGVIGRDVSSVVVNAITLANKAPSKTVQILLKTGTNMNTYTIQNSDGTTGSSTI